MYFPGQNRLIGFAISVLLLSMAQADDEPSELRLARAQFQKEMEFALRPIRDRYVGRLETLKRSLASRGDVRAAVAVQDEIDLIVATTNESAIAAKYVGSWVGEFKGGSRRFTVKSDSIVEWFNQDGSVYSTGRLVRLGKDFVFNWDTIDQIDRVTLAEGGMVMESFGPKSTFPKGAPLTRATLTKTASAK